MESAKRPLWIKDGADRPVRLTRCCPDDGQCLSMPRVWLYKEIIPFQTSAHEPSLVPKRLKLDDFHETIFGSLTDNFMIIDIPSCRRHTNRTPVIDFSVWLFDSTPTDQLASRFVTDIRIAMKKLSCTKILKHSMKNAIFACFVWCWWVGSRQFVLVIYLWYALWIFEQVTGILLA